MSKKKQTMRLIDAPIYGYWQTLYMAFYSSRLYIDVARRWRGFGVLYLLFIIAIASIPLSVSIIIYFNRYFDEQMILPLENLPPLYVQNGKVVFDEPMPYLIKNRSGDVVAVIDTTGSTVTKMIAAYPQLTILITKNKLYFRPPSFQFFLNNPAKTSSGFVSIQTLNKASNEVFVGKKWVESSGILKLKLTSEIIIYPVVVMFIFAVYVVFMIFLALMGQLFAWSIFKLKLTFQEACRLFLVASTAQIAVFFTLFTANIILPGTGIFYVALMSTYFSYAVISVRRESKKMVPA